MAGETMASSEPRFDLSPLQRTVLAEFFRRERGFFLTGGGALVGYHLHHRNTDDLDLFTMDAAAYDSLHVLPEVADSLGGRLEVRQDAPGYRRYALTRGDETLVIDVDRERVAQVRSSKPEIGGVFVDPPEEILANKLTALVGRQEERDPVGVGPRTSYEWEYSPDGGKTWVAAPSTIQAKTVVTGLTAATMVMFRYRTVTKTGVSDWSQP